MLGINALNVAVPQFLRWIIDQGISGQNVSVLGWAVLGLLALTLAGVGIAIIIFALAPNFGLVLIAAASIGLCLVVARAGLATLTQQLVPDQIRGRVESAVNMVVSVSTAAAQGLSGVLGDPHFLGVQGVFIGAGAITLAAGVSAIYALRGVVQAVTSRYASRET